MSSSAEAFFAKRVREESGKSVYPVMTDPDAMRDRIRRAILDCSLAECRFGRRQDGSFETFRQAYERFYGIPLEPPPTTTTKPTGDDHNGQSGI